MLGATRLKLWRAIAGLAAASAVVILVNQLRLGLIAWFTYLWGIDVGFEIAHVFVGSIIGILGFAASVLVLFLIMGVRRRKRR
jgi:exosortase/archaeosortase family protein